MFLSLLVLAKLFLMSELKTTSLLFLLAVFDLRTTPHASAFSLLLRSLASRNEAFTLFCVFVIAEVTFFSLLLRLSPRLAVRGIGWHEN